MTTESHSFSGEVSKVLTLATLIDAYLSDPDSGFHNLRHATKTNYRALMERLSVDHGHEATA